MRARGAVLRRLTLDDRPFSSRRLLLRAPGVVRKALSEGRYERRDGTIAVEGFILSDTEVLLSHEGVQLPFVSHTFDS